MLAIGFDFLIYPVGEISYIEEIRRVFWMQLQIEYITLTLDTIYYKLNKLNLMKEDFIKIILYKDDKPY